MFELIFGIMVLAVAYFTGSWAERAHFKRIRHREDLLRRLPYFSDSPLLEGDKVKELKLVEGSCVISADRFKVFIGSIIAFFGGRIGAYESLLERARREAIIRMREKAGDADMIINTRIQNSELARAQIEAIAYGTAIYLDKT